MLGHSNRHLLLIAFSALLGACGGGGGTTNPPSATAIAKTSGDAQSGGVGLVLADPIQVLVTENGAASPGATVNWSTTDPGGLLNPATVATDANGMASAQWLLGTRSGAQTATAAVSGASGSPLTFGATALPAAATTLEKGAGDNQTGVLNTQLATAVQARATDGFGNGLPGVGVAWAGSGGAVSSATVPTDGSGVSAVTFTVGGTAGPIIITATADGLSGSPLTFNGTAVVTPPTPMTAAVTVGNIFFRSNHNSTTNSAVDTVAVGGTVTWTWVNTASTPHSVESNGTPSFTSSVLKTGNGQSYAVTFPTAGNYVYTCAEHPGQMTGRVVVK